MFSILPSWISGFLVSLSVDMTTGVAGGMGGGGGGREKQAEIRNKSIEQSNTLGRFVRDGRLTFSEEYTHIHVYLDTYIYKGYMTEETELRWRKSDAPRGKVWLCLPGANGRRRCNGKLADGRNSRRPVGSKTNSVSKRAHRKNVQVSVRDLTNRHPKLSNPFSAKRTPKEQDPHVFFCCCNK